MLDSQIHFCSSVQSNHCSVYIIHIQSCEPKVWPTNECCSCSSGKTQTNKKRGHKQGNQLVTLTVVNTCQGLGPIIDILAINYIQD